MWNHKLTYIFAGTLLAAVLFTGCASERLEDELSYRQVGINSMQTGDYEGAVAAFNSALNQSLGTVGETEIDICYYKAAAQYALGDVEGARNTYDALLDFDSRNGNAYYLRGCLNIGMGDNENGLSDFSNAVKYNTDDFELYVEIYENLAANNMTAEGEEYLNRAFDIKGDSAENLAWRGKIYYLLGQYDNAAKELDAAIKKESVVANLYLAQVYEAQGDAANAESYYQAYVAAGVADSVAMNALAEIEMAKGNYANALDYIGQGLAMDNITNQRDLLSNQIIAYEYTGDFKAAWTVVQQYISLYPEDASAQREYIFLKNRQTEEIDAVEPEATEQIGSIDGTEEKQEDTQSQDTEPET